MSKHLITIPEEELKSWDSENRDDTVSISWPERWIKKRYGLLLLFSLIMWPFLGLIPQLESLVVNGLLLDSYWQLAYLTITNVIAFFFAISILRVLGARNPGGKTTERLVGDGEAPWGWYRILIVAMMATIAPLFLAFRFGSEFPYAFQMHCFRAVPTVMFSAAIGVSALWSIGGVKCWLFGSHKESRNYFPFESRSSTGLPLLQAPFRTLEQNLKWLGFTNTDVQFLLYLLILAVLHHRVATSLENESYWLSSAPSMLVLLLWLLFMVLSGLANWLDRWRIPTLLVFVLSLTILMSIRGSTRLLNTFRDNSENRFISHILQIRDRENDLLDKGGDITQRRLLIAEQTGVLDEIAWQAITKRMEHLDDFGNKKGKTLVVVTCPGGGIHAAAWASCVLDQLSAEYDEFRDSICIISGVSGGSVGALMFVGSQFENELANELVFGEVQKSTEEIHRDLKTRSPALEMAARSALEAIAFGATVDDLYSLVGFTGVGRGQRLEDSLSSRLSSRIQNLTMGQWGDRSIEGTVPIVIFNSTDAVTGRRILFDTIPTPQRTSSVGLKARPINYRELLDNRNQKVDLRPATAARTSATFPYISPFTKPSCSNELGENVAICDGGYVDNEGIVTAVNWIEFLLKRWASENGKKRSFDRILLLRIEPSPVEDRNEPGASGGLPGTLRWLVGPGEAMANVRSASQLERGNLETDLASLYLKLNPREQTVRNGANQDPVAKRSVGATSQPPNLIDIPSFDKRKLSQSVIRNNWERMLDKFESSEKAFSARPEILPKAVIDEGAQVSSNDAPVIVQTISFVDANQSIPLNWKLSNRQKLGYLLAWDICAGEGTPLRETLDRYFHRTMGDTD
jgi:hypothetical protein